MIAPTAPAHEESSAVTVDATRATDDLRLPAASSWSHVRLLGYALLGLQLIGFLWFSTYEFLHFDESQDFATYTQAISQIASGHLNPFGTILGTSFWRNNSEFILWPMALLYRVLPHPLMLLWIQDIALVATEVITFDWICRILRRSSSGRRWTQGLALVAAITLALDPWSWNTIAFDFHPHVIATLFAVLAGRDLWIGRGRRALVWTGAALLGGGPSALYMCGVGAAALVSCRSERRRSMAVLGMSGAWFLFLTQVGGDGVGGIGLGHWYGYLAGRHTGKVGIGAVALGALTHPARLVHMAGVRWPVALTFVAVAGIFGLFSPWGFFTGAVVFLPTIFNADPVYLRIQQSFQSWPAIPFLMVGTVSVLVWLSSRTSLAKRIGSVFLASWLSTAAVICASTLPRLQAEWLNLGPAASSTLQRAQRQIPAGAEVVTVDQVLGRFGARPFVYLLGAQWFNNGTIPLKRPVIYFVLAPNGRDDGGSAQQRLTAAVAFVQHLGATSILAQHDVYAFAWRVPDGQRSLSVPDGIS